jgi:hypothetical protein
MSTVPNRILRRIIVRVSMLSSPSSTASHLVAGYRVTRCLGLGAGNDMPLTTLVESLLVLGAC